MGPDMDRHGYILFLVALNKNMPTKLPTKYKSRLKMEWNTEHR